MLLHAMCNCLIGAFLLQANTDWFYYDRTIYFAESDTCHLGNEVSNSRFVIGIFIFFL